MPVDAAAQRHPNDQPYDSTGIHAGFVASPLAMVCRRGGCNKCNKARALDFGGYGHTTYGILITLRAIKAESSRRDYAILRSYSFDKHQPPLRPYQPKTRCIHCDE